MTERYGVDAQNMRERNLEITGLDGDRPLFVSNIWLDTATVIGAAWGGAALSYVALWGLEAIVRRVM